MAAPPEERPAAPERSITLNQLRTFKAVAELLSFSAAAQELRLSQPTVSYQVKELEAALGLGLLDRLGKRVQLTEAGQLLYDYVRRTFNLLDEATQALGELRGMERGSLRVGASTTVGIYVIPHALGAFKRSHPGLAISLEIGNRGQVQESVLRNRLDLAVVGPPLRDPELTATRFLIDQLVLVAPTGHPLAARSGLTLADLASEPFIMREPGSSTRWEVEKAARQSRVDLKVAMELGSNGAVKHAVEGGLGLAAISRYAIELERSTGDLVVLDVAGFPLRRQWHIVHLRRRRLPAAVAGFIELLKAPDWLPQMDRP